MCERGMDVIPSQLASELICSLLGSVLFPFMRIRMKYSIDTTGRYIWMGLMRSRLKAA